MNKADFWMDVIKFTLPAVLVLIGVFVLLKKFFENEERKRYFELRANNIKASLPIRLQAYERMALLMERLNVNNLIMRVKKPGMSAADLQGSLLAEIRAEFDHNLSQQIYISHEAWQNIVAAREGTARLINMSYSQIHTEATALDFSKVIFDNLMKEEHPPTFRALLFIKKEAQEMF
jgi:hypothetical protein